MNRFKKLINGRYEIGLITITLERSLLKKPSLLELKEKGYAREATPEDLNTQWPRVWYCPTFIVHNENKFPPKPRVVTDVAAQVDCQSLNSNLLSGSDNMAPLLGGIFRFRENRIAVNAFCGEAVIPRLNRRFSSCKR